MSFVHFKTNGWIDDLAEEYLLSIGLTETRACQVCSLKLFLVWLKQQFYKKVDKWNRWKTNVHMQFTFWYRPFSNTSSVQRVTRCHRWALNTIISLHYWLLSTGYQCGLGLILKHCLILGLSLDLHRSAFWICCSFTLTEALRSASYWRLKTKGDWAFWVGALRNS